ncbi:BZ3500_MvSof-1268-A1-R1_Chr5-1g07606 [Microbotryum saponariae]|uniref:BZ3500_MvSof-1268-A1-R1_Chr5-1g07606 protein n=1 Tax=Microbotryum saponariae TaxID=289078 RepID=A0A2X0NJC4_9BASI|nr:BZ3500_MvSof-1268-A1-R1_Chr5-1g07606 [Microbotryum saponariae]SDA05477.1 BZ3501_MvSof-1269-A2-R1_Chr5-2g07430 [Microbotryum saponariae]
MASLTCSPVVASPLNAVDTTPTLELVPGSEQVANFTKRAISGPPTLDYIPTSILTRGVSHIVLPSITIPSGRGLYKWGDTINLRWKPTKYPKYTNLWFEVSMNTGAGVTGELLKMPPRNGREVDPD